MTIAEARIATFREFIPVTGIVQPISTIYLDLLEGGQVEEIFVEDGAILTAGQPILRLKNTDLEMNMISQEATVLNVLVQAQISQNSARQNTISKQTSMVDMDNQLREAKRIYDLYTGLYESEAIAYQDFQEAKNKYDYYLERRTLALEVLKQDSIAVQQQMEQLNLTNMGSRYYKTGFIAKSL
jgi:HlyD family secretion protein